MVKLHLVTLSKYHAKKAEMKGCLIVIFLPVCTFCNSKSFVDDSPIEDEDRLEDPELDEDFPKEDEDRLEDPELDEDSPPMEDEDRLEDPELDEDSIDDLSDIDRWNRGK